MAERRAPIRQPATAERRPALMSRAASATTARPLTATRTLQRRLGNSGTQAFAARLAARSESTVVAPLQASLAISAPADPYEKEAERVADMVMRVPAPLPPEVPDISSVPATGAPVRRACAACQDEFEHEPSAQTEEADVHRKETTASVPQVTPAIEANIRAPQGTGSPLPQATRDFFEPRFGADFSQVRINSGARAHETAQVLGARAFTVGQSISFASGQYAPTSHEGQRLLAHELTHVVQQDAGIRRAGAKVERKKAEPREPAAPAANLNIASTPGPRLQPAWYNIDIPFTDYQFDPSIEGVKTAAGVVKDKAVEAFDWIVEQIKDLVNAGIDWLRDKWNDLQQFAASAWNAAKDAFTGILQFLKDPLGFLADTIMNLNAESLSRAWARLSALVTSVSNGFKGMADKLLSGINKLWGFISGYATSLLHQLAKLTSNFLFKKLPDALQSLAIRFVDMLKNLWKAINDGWTRLIGRIKAWVDHAIDIVIGFVRKVLGFGINVVIKGIVQFGQLVLFLKDLFANPLKYVGMLVPRTVKAFDGVESRFAGVVAQHFGSTRAPAPAVTTTVKGPAASTTVHRAPDPKAATESKTSATWGEIGRGVRKVMGEKWDQFKANPMTVVWGLLRDLIVPIAGNIEDIGKLFKDIYHIVTGPLSAGSLEDLWTSLLRILDIPVLIYHTVVSILMRTLMLPLIVASFIPHPLVKGIAAAVGYGLLGMFVESELLNIGHKLLLLKTGRTTEAQKQEAYNRVADSLLAFAMALAISLFMLLLHFLANVAKGIYGFIKGKVFGIEPAPVEAKGTGPGAGKGSKAGPEEAKATKPKTEEPAARELGKQNGKKVMAEERTADGKHEVKVTEEGIRCCSDLCELMIKEIDGHVAENPALHEKLEPFRKQLETAQGKVESARIVEERAPPEGKAAAARDLQAAADAAAEVGAKLKPQIERVVKDTPLPSGLRFNEYSTPEHAMGMKEGAAKPAGWDPVTKPESILDGYTRREYYLDDKGTKWSFDTRPVNGGKAYKLVHKSSGQ